MTTVFRTGLPATDTLTLQCCGECGQVNYPVRELCGHCLADRLQWQSVTATGLVQSLTALGYSLEPAYAKHLPWTVASIVLDCGPVVLAHLAPGIEVDTVVRLRVVRDAAGNRMLVATGIEAGSQEAAASWLQRVGFEEIQT